MHSLFEFIWDWLGKNHEAFISSLAFIAVAVQAYAAYTQNRQSVRPYLHVGFEKKDNFLCVLLQNSGLGPAIVDDYYIVLKNKEYRGEQIIDAFKQYPARFKEVNVNFVNPGFAVSAGDKITILEAKLDNPAHDFEAMQSFLDDNYELVIKYHSFQKEKRTYTTETHVWPDTSEKKCRCCTCACGR